MGFGFIFVKIRGKDRNKRSRKSSGNQQLKYKIGDTKGGVINVQLLGTTGKKPGIEKTAAKKSENCREAESYSQSE